MTTDSSRRSQPLMRRPVDRVSALVTFHDASELECTLFVPIGKDVVEMFGDGPRYIPIGVADSVRLVARDVIAAIAIGGRAQSEQDYQEHQLATVHLRGGNAISGELWWNAPEGKKRTTDFLNADTPYLILHRANVTTYIAKSHVAWMSEA
jgi:hypothetical protein